jgi:hypothetical protein
MNHHKVYINKQNIFKEINPQILLSANEYNNSEYKLSGSFDKFPNNTNAYKYANYESISVYQYQDRWFYQCVSKENDIYITELQNAPIPLSQRNRIIANPITTAMIEPLPLTYSSTVKALNAILAAPAPALVDGGKSKPYPKYTPTSKTVSKQINGITKQRKIWENSRGIEFFRIKINNKYVFKRV